MKGLRAWLWAHPLVWLIPASFFLVLLLALAWKIASVPSSPFVYDL